MATQEASPTYRLGDVLGGSDSPEFQVAGILGHSLSQLSIKEEKRLKLL